MNYRHAFHAGNHADVLKHAVLWFCLERLLFKETPFAVMDTHAGAGRYDLESDAAQRSPEWRGGVGKLLGWRDAPALIAAYREAVMTFNCEGGLRTYPGSPALIAKALRAQDRLIACELHPEDAGTLRRRFSERANVQVHERDGYEAIGALLPPPERRGLVLIDPPYEAADEMARAVAALKLGLKRFGHGAFIWWRPLKDAHALDRADSEIGAPLLRTDLWLDDPAATSKLVGSSLAIVHPPYGLEDALRDALPALAERLAMGRAGWRLALT
ncbi:MAG: 23S rRNA (adenine(2030)-N(6))-methyltransferase RlmJ [Hyphomonadaceae bacterium]